MGYRFGLIGSITTDSTTSSDGLEYSGLGGILYHAAALCGLGQSVRLIAHAGESLKRDLAALADRWPGLDISRLAWVSGEGNRVHLHYPQEGEREEVLRSVVPPLQVPQVLPSLRELDFLIFVASSGMDISLADWRAVCRACSFPVWFDVHSLVLSRVVGKPRVYIPLKDWMDWTEGAAYIQANRVEAGCMLGHPGVDPSEADLSLIHI